MTTKLLIVEDENLEKEALKKIIEKNYKEILIVGTATSGYEAIKLAEQFKPDIILMDIGLPELDGLSAQKKIIEFSPNVKTIILTAYSDFQHAQKAINSKVADYLVKPIRTKELKKSINTILETLHQENLTISSPEKMNEIGKNEIIRKALKYVEENYTENIQLKTLAEILYLNPQYLSRLFKKELNINFSEFLILYRLEISKDLLKSTSLPIYAVATKSGFTDASYYCKIFKKFLGVSPLKFRNSF